MNRRAGVLGFFAAVCGVMSVAPSTARAQACWASCEVCTGAGHKYGATGSNSHKGNEAHDCGNAPVCGQGYNVHDPCDGGEMNNAGDAIRRLRDAHDLLNHQWLTGSQIRDIVARSDGRLYVNPDRRSIQQRDCNDRQLVVVNLPLNQGQYEEYLIAAQAELELVAEALSVHLSPSRGQ